LEPLAVAFKTELSEARLQAYWAALADVELAAFQYACARALKEKKFFPVPATLRELAGCPVDALSPAEAAWYRLRNLSGRYNREALADPLTREVFDAMGGAYVLEWGFGNWKTEKEEAKKREFISRYHEARNAKALVRSRGERV
jgi:hypothetical protein